jgi:hypothetical protein
MDSPTIQHVQIQVEEVMCLVENALAHDDLDRAMYWGALVLTVNDPHDPADGP